MEPSSGTIPKQCYQCGTATMPLNFTADTAESGWFSCGKCGERIVSHADFAALVRDQQERAIRDKLGVDEFLGARRIDKGVADD